MAAAATTAAPPALRSPWIISPWADALLVVGCPLVVAPVLYALAQVLPPEAVALFVLGTLSTGHHLPGFFRAYGDPVLFRRYRARFVGIPLLLFPTVLWFTWNDLGGAVLVVAVWGVWHGFMQTYGFMRIYDAKRGEHSRLTRRLDWLVVVSAWIAVLLWSETVSARLLEASDAAGFFFMPVLLSDGFRQAATAAAIVLGLAYALHTAVRIARGQPVAPLKLVLLVTSVGFLYGSWVLAGGTLLLGLAAFEAFHDVQYLAIAWAYNRRLVEKGTAPSHWMRALFRPGAAVVIVYVALSVAYGGFANAEGFTPGRALGAVFAAIVLTSAILHFYFDGFIWKVSQAKTREDLDLPPLAAPGGGAPSPKPGSRGRELAQFALLGAPLAVLALLGLQREALELPMRELTVRLLPHSAQQRLDLGAAYQRRGRSTDAIGQYEAALRADPALRESSLRLAQLWLDAGRPARAVDVLERALALSPDDPRVEAGLARSLLAGSPDLEQVRRAASHAERVVQRTGAREPEPLIVYAVAAAALGERDASLRSLERARATDAARRDPGVAQRIERLLARFDAN